MIYKWKQGSRVALDAEVAGAELERIRVHHNGRLESETVVREARSPANPLHPAFEWNDKTAAHQFRIEQAKYLIRSIEVVVDEAVEQRPIRAFVSVVREEDRSYTSVTDAMMSPDLRKQVLATALRELVAWRDRYAELVELANVFASIEEARSAI